MGCDRHKQTDERGATAMEARKNGQGMLGHTIDTTAALLFISSWCRFVECPPRIIECKEWRGMAWQRDTLKHHMHALYVTNLLDAL